jgi:hypothetical protein
MLILIKDNAQQRLNKRAVLPNIINSAAATFFIFAFETHLHR